MLKAKKESELKIKQEAYNMAKLLFDDNWSEVLVCSQKYYSSMNGAFLVLYDDTLSQFIQEEEEEMVNVDPAIEFTGEDIHDLIPQYLQNSYDILYSILPGTYHRVYLYIENDGTVCRQLGYIIVDGEYLTFEEMVDRKVVSKATYDATMEQMALWSNYMRNAFIACHLEPWTVFSYMIDEERHISTNFGYDVLAEQTYDNELFDLWSYEKLGIKSPNLPDDKIATIVPENEYAKFLYKGV